MQKKLKKMGARNVGNFSRRRWRDAHHRLRRNLYIKRSKRDMWTQLVPVTQCFQDLWRNLSKPKILAASETRCRYRNKTAFPRKFAAEKSFIERAITTSGGYKTVVHEGTLAISYDNVKWLLIWIFRWYYRWVWLNMTPLLKRQS